MRNHIRIAEVIVINFATIVIDDINDLFGKTKI